MKKSRFQEHIQRQTKINIFIIVIGSLFFLFLIVFFGLQILVQVTSSLEQKNSTIDNNKKNDDVQYISVPVLDPIENATNSAEINITGYTSEKQTVALYVNGTFFEKTNSDNKNTFRFKNVPLDKGDNFIKAKTISDNNKQSDYSNQLTISYINKSPDLEINYPENGASFKGGDGTIQIKGKTNSDTKITVNNFWALVDNDGNFTYSIKLSNGDNTIKVAASDEAGNKTEKEIKVTYSP